jgi:anti-sigma regulatory factor (Ser/Thr protein kinase)
MGTPAVCASQGGYVHEAFFYAGDDDFVSSSADFVTEGLRRGEHVVVAVVAEKAELLRAALDGQAARVTFMDMAECGRNPARIIQLWHDLVEAAELRGTRVRGIGEPIWAARTDDELLEAQLHEALLNDAFDADSRLLLRCPYDVSSLDRDVLVTARATHPEVVDGQGRTSSAAFSPDAVVGGAFREPLLEPAVVEEELSYGPLDLLMIRRQVAVAAARHDMPTEDVEALVLSVREIAVNSIRHGGGSGRLRMWVDAGRLVCELSDSGHIAESMVGRLRPPPEREHGRGVWLANQLCDLVQIRSSDRGTVVRLHVGVPPLGAVSG